ncbi:MAG: anthranilate synthase component I [Chloroflexi bacterium]|nr:anthranilate synthase component I [Chloroflexota bacterium]
MAVIAEAGQRSLRYRTRGGVEVQRLTTPLPVAGAIEPIVDALDEHLGVLLASSYEYPGRYTRWDIGFIDPPLQLVTRERSFAVDALNERGQVLVPSIAEAIAGLEAVEDLEVSAARLRGRIREPERRFAEEERSKQRSAFSLVRGLVDLFWSAEDPHLGLYGAFAYDLAFQFEPIPYGLPRPADKRDLVLFLADELVVVDHTRGVAVRHEYEMSAGGRSTRGLPRTGVRVPFRTAESVDRASDLEPREYAATVRLAHEAFRRGDLFEVVPGRTFFEPCRVPPSELFRRLRERNPAPYGALMNLGRGWMDLGAGEHLVSASPEMYVRVDGSRVETCPISGTIARGSDVMGDAEAIVELLNSEKDESELTMCTDVDRNDKSRICVPGSVRVIGRRQIEMYSRVIHTVDHVEGILREGYDAIDAFLTHAWAVTVTGAPKLWAMRFIEERERSPRGWYGGAIGFVGFDGNMNTGLTLRTIQVKDGVASVRAGATLLIDSDPDAEEREIDLKAAAFLDAIRRPRGTTAVRAAAAHPGAGRRVLLVDHEDSFVHTLANYLRQTGTDVLTVRAATRERLEEVIRSYRPDGIVLSPGPGRPSDFDVAGAVDAAVSAEIPLFGVCLGLQGIVERFGGELGVLPYPMHGKTSEISVLGGAIFQGLPRTFRAGRYHSLYAVRETLPRELRITAVADDGVIMAIEHERLPIAAVQFHPESILTLKDEVGSKIVHNVVARLIGGGPVIGKSGD